MINHLFESEDPYNIKIVFNRTNSKFKVIKADADYETADFTS